MHSLDTKVTQVELIDLDFDTGGAGETDSWVKVPMMMMYSLPESGSRWYAATCFLLGGKTEKGYLGICEYSRLGSWGPSNARLAEAGLPVYSDALWSEERTVSGERPRRHTRKLLVRVGRVIFNFGGAAVWPWRRDHNHICRLSNQHFVQ